MSVNIAEQGTCNAKKLLAEGLAGLRFTGDNLQNISILRTAPKMANLRAERASLSGIAADNDVQVREWSDLAQIATHRDMLSDAEFYFWRCVESYPFHQDFAFRYGEVLFKQGKFVDAESWLRNALALGHSTTTLYDLIRICTEQQGLDDAISDRMLRKAAASPDGKVLCATSDGSLYPDLFTIKSFCHILLDNLDPSLDIRIKLQRSAWDAPSLLAAIIALPEFRYKNLNLLLVLKSRISEGLI